MCLLYSLVTAANDFEGLLAEAAAAVEDGTEAVVVLGFGETALLLCAVFPQAEKDVERAGRGVENVGAEGEL